MSTKRTFAELEKLATLEIIKPFDLQDQSILKEYAIARDSQPKLSSSNNIPPIEIDLEQENREKEEEESHAPFAKRARTSEQNYEYIRENRHLVEQEQIRRGQEASSNIEKNIINLSIEDVKPKIKKEQLLPDIEEEATDLDEIIYSNRAFNLIGFSNYPDLPIKPLRAQILHYLEKCNIMIIQGNTGCGKTTQVPQMILDHAANLNRHCNICVTQPRRLAAVSVCKRVCEERNWVKGSICGFKFQTERSLSKDTRILYLTTGSLIQSLINNESYIKKYTHIILDEIHERDLDTDLIILLLKIKLLEGYTGKIILMSATLDPQIFIKYFQSVVRPADYKIPVIKCEFNRFEVELFYLDDLESVLKIPKPNMPESTLDQPGLTEETMEITAKLLDHFDKLESDNTDQDTISGFPCERGSVLIFISGLNDIGRLDNYLRETMPNSQLIIRGLHSDFSIDQQAEVFNLPPAGYRKVIISTSIAESSITVPDVKYVIDFCLTKCLYCDELTNYTELRCEWASESNMDQRRGRAGRVQNGKCYRLITKDFKKEYIQKHPSPAIERQPLDKLILNLKKLRPDYSPDKILSMAMTHPKLDQIEKTMILLKEVGAISLYKDGSLSAVDGDITYGGSIMSTLPVDVKLAKLVLFGHIFGKLREAVIIAASLSVKNLYSRHYRSYLEAYRTKFSYSQGLFCDFNCIVNTYNIFEDKFPDSNNYKMNRNEARRQRENKEIWCKEHGIELRRIEEMRKIKNEIEQRLLDQHNIRFEYNKHLRKENDADFTEQDAIDQYYVLKFMVAAAFYPNYFKTVEVDQDRVIRDLNTKNPKNTVRLKGLPENQNLPENSPILYYKAIKDAYGHCATNLIVHFDGHKVFIEFRNADNELTHLTKVSLGVYLSVCMRQLRLRPKLPELKTCNQNKTILREIERKKAIESTNYATASSNRITINSDQDALSDPNLIIKDLNEFKLVIVQIEQFGHFYAQINSENSRCILEKIQTDLNRSTFKLKQLKPDQIHVGKLVATVFISSPDEALVYRAKIIRKEETFVEIFYVDFGNKEEKDLTTLFELSKDLTEIPYQAFECRLAHVRLDPFRASDRNYANKACDQFSKLVEFSEENLFGKVYSIVNNVVRLDLFDVKSEFYRKNIAESLIKLEYCERCDEDQYSQDKHRERLNKFTNSTRNNFYEQKKSTNEWITVKDLEGLIDQAEFYPLDNEYPFLLEGAHSPLEVKCIPMSKRLSSVSNVSIEQSSINYVLLDDEPEVRSSNLLVAHKIEFDTLHENGSSRVKLRNTCLFPKHSGIVSLCLLLFSPSVELRVNSKTKKSYSGALCGLGFDKYLKKALFIENNIEDVFEVEFDPNDIDDINSVRETFNKIIGSEPVGKKLLSEEYNERLNKQRRFLNDTILKLLKKKRNKIENPVHFRNAGRWNQYDDECYFDYGFEKNRIDNKLRRENKSCFIHIRKISFSNYAKYEKRHHRY